MKVGIFIFCLFYVGISAKSCADQVKELAASPMMRGQFKPVCQANGMFAEMQYHASYYYCVKPETGEEILGTRIRFTKPKSCKATTCFLQRHEGLLKSKSQMVGHFTPQCEEDGSFKTIQCHGSTGFCYCVAPATGVKVVGTEVRGMPQCGVKACLKQVKELEAKPLLMGAFKPVCQDNGMYNETQCHGSTGFCFCVKPETGEEIMGTRVRFTKPKTCKSTPCMLQRHDGLLKTQSKMVGHFTPQCEEDGSFKAVQCHGSTGFCYCVAPTTGVKVVGTEVRGQPDCSGVKATTACLKQVKELEAKPLLMGAFKPVCQDNGMYAETQCHGSTGFCFCVKPETGEEILGTRVRFTKPKTCKSTSCMLQRHDGLLKTQSKMVGHFTPQCEEDGSFKTVQCHASTGFCYCVAPTTGVKVVGTEVRGQPDCSGAASTCLKQVKDLEAKPKLLGAFKPVCQDNGMYAEIQCHASYCYCVKPESGEELLGTRVRFTKPTSCKSTPCVMQRHSSMKDSEKGMTGQFTPECEADGSFSKTQCHSSTGFCFCVMPETGEKLFGTELRFKKPLNCELTDCIKQRHMALKSKLLGVFKPVCDESGAYATMQCKGGVCYCAFPNSGAEVLGTKLQRGQKPVSCELTKCLKKRHDVLSKPLLLGARKVECTDDGKFNPIQCHEGMCSCVNTETGEEILGTMVRFSKPESCKLTPCVMARHKAWKLTQVGLLGVPISRCSANGDYEKVQCRYGKCWCVDPKTGKKVDGKSAQWTVPNCA